MTFIQLDTVDSTNDYLKAKSQSSFCDDFTTVVARDQTRGKGQHGHAWKSNPNQNLTFSILKLIVDMPLIDQFKINMAVGLGIIDGLSMSQSSKFYLKWPNDIIVDDLKLGGVLIENIVQGQTWKKSIIGIGLNVNQTDFKYLPKATSLALIGGKYLSLDELLFQMTECIKSKLSNIEHQSFDHLKMEYLKILYRCNVWSRFQFADGAFFEGKIKGITHSGQLHLLNRSGQFNDYDLKTIKLIY